MCISRASAAVCNQQLIIVDDGSARPDDYGIASLGDARSKKRPRSGRVKAVGVPAKPDRTGWMKVEAISMLSQSA
jgi:hypothetical protein